MEQLVERMQRIAKSAEKMTEMIGVIDSIAFQTNILALNASVEPREPVSTGAGSRWLPARCGCWQAAVLMHLRKFAR